MANWILLFCDHGLQHMLFGTTGPIPTFRGWNDPSFTGAVAAAKSAHTLGDLAAQHEKKRPPLSCQAIFHRLDLRMLRRIPMARFHTTVVQIVVGVVMVGRPTIWPWNILKPHWNPTCLDPWWNDHHRFSPHENKTGSQLSAWKGNKVPPRPSRFTSWNRRNRCHHPRDLRTKKDVTNWSWLSNIFPQKKSDERYMTYKKMWLELEIRNCRSQRFSKWFKYVETCWRLFNLYKPLSLFLLHWLRQHRCCHRYRRQLS